MDKLLNISIQYAKAKLMSKKNQNAIDDYEEAIRQFPCRIPDFSPFSGVLERGESINDYTAQKARKLLDPYKATFAVIKDTYKKPFCHWPIDGALGSTTFPNGDNYVTVAKLLLIRSKLECYRGRFDEAIEDARRVLQMGQHLNHGPLLMRLLGIKIEKMGIEAFLELVQSLRTPDEADKVMAVLKEHLDHQDPYDYLSLVSYERVEWPNVQKTFHTEAALRARVDLAPLWMLRAAVASKKYYLTNNRQWPASITMLVPDYLKEAPIDPFGREPLNIYLFPSGGFRLYSIGPDRRDDKGDIPYDPARGLNSTGDILIDIR
jgi:hypothetical protein